MHPDVRSQLAGLRASESSGTRRRRMGLTAIAPARESPAPSGRTWRRTARRTSTTVAQCYRLRGRNGSSEKTGSAEGPGAASWTPQVSGGTGTRRRPQIADRVDNGEDSGRVAQILKEGSRDRADLSQSVCEREDQTFPMVRAMGNGARARTAPRRSRCRAGTRPGVGLSEQMPVMKGAVHVPTAAARQGSRRIFPPQSQPDSPPLEPPETLQSHGLCVATVQQVNQSVCLQGIRGRLSCRRELERLQARSAHTRARLGGT